MSDRLFFLLENRCLHPVEKVRKVGGLSVRSRFSLRLLSVVTKIKYTAVNSVIHLELKNAVSRPIIAIAGASASGKTLFTRTVVEELCAEFSQDSLAVLEEDGYYRDQSHLPMKLRQQTNYDHPRAFEHELLSQHLHCLKNGEAVDVPTYDYENHTRSSLVRRVTAADVILVEGILLLADPDLRQSFDIKVFIDTPLDICLLRRIERDVNERGRSLPSVAKQYEATVRPMYYEFIEPSKQQADVVVTGGGKNRVAIDMVKDSIRSSLRS